MALPDSGDQISFSQIQLEFGGTNPISLSEYYRDSAGGFVSSIGAANTTIPASGNAIGLSSFAAQATADPVTITYEITGSGGGGGTSGNVPGLTGSGGAQSGGEDGGASSILAPGTTIVASGGAKGIGSAIKYTGNFSNPGGNGGSSFYGSGGSAGAPGSNASLTAYGAGGGGRNGYFDGTFTGVGGSGGGGTSSAGSVGNGQAGFTIAGGAQGERKTGTFQASEGATITIRAGNAGRGGAYGLSSSLQGGDGAPGYIKLTIHGTDYTYAGIVKTDYLVTYTEYSLTVPAAP